MEIFLCQGRGRGYLKSNMVSFISNSRTKWSLDFNWALFKVSEQAIKRYRFRRLIKIVRNVPFNKAYVFSVLYVEDNFHNRYHWILVIMTVIWLFYISSLKIEYCISFLWIFGKRASVIAKEKEQVFLYPFSDSAPGTNVF